MRLGIPYVLNYLYPLCCHIKCFVWLCVCVIWVFDSIKTIQISNFLGIFRPSVIILYIKVKQNNIIKVVLEKKIEPDKRRSFPLLVSPRFSRSNHGEFPSYIPTCPLHLFLAHKLSACPLWYS